MICPQNVLKRSLQDVLKTSWRRLQNVLNKSWRCLEDVLKTSWRRLGDVLKTFLKRCLEDVLRTSWKRLKDVLKTYDQEDYVGLDQDVLKTSWRRLLKTITKDVFIKTNVCWVPSHFRQLYWFSLQYFHSQKLPLLLRLG